MSKIQNGVVRQKSYIFKAYICLIHLNEFSIAFLKIKPVSFTNDLFLRVAIISSANFFIQSLIFFNETEFVHKSARNKLVT